MKNIVLKLSISLIIAVCACALTATANTVPAVEQAGQEEDSVTIVGKFISPCSIPDKIKFIKYSVWDMGSVFGDQVPVNKNGDFSFRTSITGLQQIGLIVSRALIDVIVTPGQKTYHVDIICDSNNQPQTEEKDSYENKAFSLLSAINKTLTDSLTQITQWHALDDGTYPGVKRLFLDYQRKVESIIHDFPSTQTAKILCTSEILPESDFSSLQSLRENYLNREAFANPEFYGTNFLFSRIFANYFLLLPKNNASFIGFGKALDIAGKDPEAAKLLQQAFYANFYNMKKERALQGYIDWAKEHPDRMVNLAVKARLASIENCMPGSPFFDIMLNDPNGVTRKLSETVAGAKLTLLIFYSPTCPHCQETLPRFLPYWNRLKDKGFKIYAVAEDATNDEWLDFISSKGTGEWVNVFKHDNGPESGIKYVLGPIPAFILIDEHGKIFTRLADFGDIQQDIQNYFGK